MSPRPPALLALSAVFLAASPAFAQRPRYTLTVIEHTNKKTGRSAYTQTLYNWRTGQIMWTRHFPSAGNITWFKDHRAVVFETTGISTDQNSHSRYQFAIAIWKEGAGLTSFFVRPKLRPIIDDYIEDFVWSSDKKHLLFRTGSSGSGSIDVGGLYCLDISKHYAILVTSSARYPQWATNGKISYEPIGYAHGQNGDGVIYESSKPRLWRLPKRF